MTQSSYVGYRSKKHFFDNIPYDTFSTDYLRLSHLNFQNRSEKSGQFLNSTLVLISKSTLTLQHKSCSVLFNITYLTHSLIFGDSLIYKTISP